MATGQFLFINSEILGQHSDGIDTEFATMGYLLAHFSVVLDQPTWHAHLSFISELTNTVPQGGYGEYIHPVSSLWERKLVC